MRRNISNRKTLYSSGFKNHIKLFAFCCLLLVISCKVKKRMIPNPVSTNITVKPTDTKIYKLEVIRAGQTSFNTFSGKAKATLDISGNTNDVTLNIRIKRDQKIWISITAIAGIEAARILITPDSLMMIDRLQSVYLKKPFSYINNFAGDEINYKTLESLLIGNAIPELINENADLQTSPENRITLTGNLNNLVYKLLVAPDMKVTQTNLDNQNAGQSLQVTNTFIQTGNKAVPSQIDMVSVVKDKKIQVNLHYVKSAFDQPLEYPFSIPARYAEEN